MKPKCIESIKNWHKPQSIQEIQTFIGFINFYRQFIWNFSAIARHFTSMFKTGLHPKTSKSTQKNIINAAQETPSSFLTKKAKESFQKLKKSFCDEFVL